MTYPPPQGNDTQTLAIIFCNASYAAVGLAISLQGCHHEHPREGCLGLGWPVPSIPTATSCPAGDSTRTENVTFIVHDQLYKRNVPTWAHVRGPFHERALEKARERARKRGQLGGVHEGHSVSHLARGLRPVPAVSPPQWAEPPHRWQGPCGGAMLGGRAVPSACFASPGYGGSWR